MSSAHCRSELDNSFSIEEHLRTLAENLNLVKKDRHLHNSEYVYREVYRFIKNFQRFDLDAELFTKKLVGKYLNLIYILLVDINDYQSEVYSRLLPEVSALISKIKKQLVAYVSSSDAV